MKPTTIIACLLAAGITVSVSPARAAPPFRTAIIPEDVVSPSNYQLEYSRIKAAGASAVRLVFSWAQIAPATRPSGFNPVNPADPAYDWETVDHDIILARAHGLEPILGLYGAPIWAQQKVPPGVPHGSRDGPYKPSPQKFGQFARAAALRYSGSFRRDDGVLLPRVRNWIAWNEPNIYVFLSPQNLDGKPFSPIWYRKLVNAFSSSVHAVHGDNVVIAGATAPFGIARRISPLTFMRDMLCMSKGRKPHPTCKQYASFDVWAHHPYTRGDPFHHAQSPDDVSLGDLPDMHLLINAAARAHHIRSKHKVQFWVTEFSYDSRPPNASKLVVPILLHARYVAESLYQMWRSGVSLGTWFLLRDAAGVGTPKSGLYFNGSPDENDLSHDWPKPALYAFRFPFVAYRDGKTVSVWGRTANSRAASVAIEVGTAYGWRRIATLRAGGNGIFTGKLIHSRILNAVRAPGISRSYESIVEGDGPRSYWRLDERSGNVAKDAMGQTEGVYDGHAMRGVAGALKNKGDRGVQFNGSGRIALPGMSPPRAVELWLKTSAKGALPAVSFRDRASGSLYVGPMARGFARASDEDSNLASFNVVNDGRWHHIVYTLGAGNQAQLYVDGRLHDESPWQPNWDWSQPSLGYDAFLGSYFKGALDEVAIYDHALSAKQVARHYAASGREVGTAGMLRARVRSDASWPFSLARPRDRFWLPFG